MKKTIVVISSILLSVVLIALIALFVCTYIIPILNIGNSQTDTQETFLMASQSPDGKYNLEAYRTEPGATVDFSIRVYLIINNKKILFMTHIMNMKPKLFGLIIRRFQLTKKHLIYHKAKNTIGVRNNYYTKQHNYCL